MNLSKQISKAKCKLANKVYKYSNLLALGINRECLYKEIQILNMLITTLENNNTEKCDCNIIGQYSFDLPNGENGYIEFLCDNIGYFHYNNQTIEFAYDYFNEQLTLYFNSYSVVYTTDLFTPVDTLFNIYINDELIYSTDGESSIEDFIENFNGNNNTNNAYSLNVELIDGQLVFTTTNTTPTNLNLINSEININNEVFSTALSNNITNITFDECCNITGEFNFDLYCYNNPLEFNINNLTLNWEDYIIKITISSYILEVLPEEYTGFQSLIDLWNETYPEIYLTGNSDGEGNSELIFYTPKTLELCDNNINLKLVTGTFTPAFTQYDFSEFELPPLAFTLQISVNAELIFSNSYETDSLLEFLNDVISDFNLANTDYIMSLEGETLIITTLNGDEYNGLIFDWRLGVGDDIIGDIEFPETQGGSSPEVEEYNSTLNNSYIVNNLQNEKDCEIPATCLNEEQLNSVLNKIKKI